MRGRRVSGCRSRRFVPALLALLALSLGALVGRAQDTPAPGAAAAGPGGNRPAADGAGAPAGDGQNPTDAQAADAQRKLLEKLKRLTQSPPPDAETLTRLVAALDSDIAWQRDRAQRRLEEAGAPAVPYLREALMTGNPEVRFRARRALTEIGEAFLVLVTLLSDRNVRMRQYGQEALVSRFLAAEEEDDALALGVARFGMGGMGGMGMGVRFPTRNGRSPRYELQQRRISWARPDYTRPLLEVLRRVDAHAPVVIHPAFFEVAGLSEPYRFRRALYNVAQVLDAIKRDKRIEWEALRLGGQVVAFVRPADIDPLGTPAAAVLALCGGVLADRAAPRQESVCQLARLFGRKRRVAALYRQSLGRRGSPCFSELLQGYAFCGEAWREGLAQPRPAITAAALGTFTAGPWYVREAVAVAVTTWESAVTQDALIMLAAHPDPEPRYLAVWALGKLEGSGAVPALADALDDAQAATARMALLALARLAPKNPPRLERAFDLGAQGDTAMREAATKYLLSVGLTGDAVAAVMTKAFAALESEKPEVRAFAAKLLAVHPDARVLARFLKRLLTETDERVAEPMLGAFTDKVTDDALWPAIAALLSHKERRMRLRGAAIIVQTALALRVMRVTDLLGKQAADSEIAVELAVILYRLGDVTRLPALAKLLTGKAEALANAAAIGLGATGTRAVLDLFSENREHEQVHTRLAVLNGLEAFAKISASKGEESLLDAGMRLAYDMRRDKNEQVQSRAREVYRAFSRAQSQARTERRRRQMLGVGPTPKANDYPERPSVPDFLFRDRSGKTTP